MPVILLEDPTPVLAALVGDVPDFEVFHGRTSDGSDWITVTWPAHEFAMERDNTGTWHVMDLSSDAIVSTGPTAYEAFKAALKCA